MKTTHVVVLSSLVLCCFSHVRGQTFEWLHQLGESRSDISRGVSADGLGNIYISCSTGGSLRGTGADDVDAFISKYDASGTLQWTRQIGTSGFDRSYGVSADRPGNVYISGYTQGSLGGTNAGDRDAFVAKITTGVAEVEYEIHVVEELVPKRRH